MTPVGLRALWALGSLLAVQAVAPGAPTVALQAGENTVTLTITPADTNAATFKITAGYQSMYPNVSVPQGTPLWTGGGCSNTWTGSGCFRDQFTSDPVVAGRMEVWKGLLPGTSVNPSQYWYNYGSVTVMPAPGQTVQYYRYDQLASINGPSYTRWGSNNIPIVGMPSVTWTPSVYLVTARLSGFGLTSGSPAFQAGIIIYDTQTNAMSSGGGGWAGSVAPRWLYRTYVSVATLISRTLGCYQYIYWGGGGNNAMYITGACHSSDITTSVPVDLYVRFSLDGSDNLIRKAPNTAPAFSGGGAGATDLNPYLQAGFMRIGYDSAIVWYPLRTQIYQGEPNNAWISNSWGIMLYSPTYQYTGNSDNSPTISNGSPSLVNWNRVQFGLFASTTSVIPSNASFSSLQIIDKANEPAYLRWIKYYAQPVEAMTVRGGVCAAPRNITRTATPPAPGTASPFTFTFKGLAHVSNYTFTVTGADAAAVAGTPTVTPAVQTFMQPPVAGRITMALDAQSVLVPASVATNGVPISSVLDPFNTDMSTFDAGSSSISAWPFVLGATATRPYNSFQFSGNNFMVYSGDQNRSQIAQNRGSNNLTWMMLYQPTAISPLDGTIAFSKSGYFGGCCNQWTQTSYAYSAVATRIVSNTYTFQTGMRVTSASNGGGSWVLGFPYGGNVGYTAGSFPIHPHSSQPTLVTVSFGQKNARVIANAHMDACLGLNRGLVTDLCTFPAPNLTSTANPWLATAPQWTAATGTGAMYVSQGPVVTATPPATWFGADQGFGTLTANTWYSSRLPFVVGAYQLDAYSNPVEYDKTIRYVGNMMAIYVMQGSMTQPETLAMQAYIADRFNLLCPALTSFPRGVIGTCGTGLQGDVCTLVCDTQGTTTGGVPHYQSAGTGYLVCSNGAWNGKALMCLPTCPTTFGPSNADLNACVRTFESRLFNPPASGPTLTFSNMTDLDSIPYLPSKFMDAAWFVTGASYGASAGRLQGSAGLKEDVCDSTQPSGLFVNQPNYLSYYATSLPLTVSSIIWLSPNSTAGLLFGIFTNTSYYLVTISSDVNRTALSATVNGVVSPSTAFATSGGGVLAGAIRRTASRVPHVLSVTYKQLSNGAMFMQAYINGTLVYNVTDRSGNQIPGGAGYGVYVQAGTAQFDNFTVTGSCDNGGASCRGLYAGQSCNFACARGFTPAPNNAVTCQANGVLTNTAFDCKPTPPTFVASSLRKVVLENATTGESFGTPVNTTVPGSGVLVFYYLNATGNNETLRDRFGAFKGTVPNVFQIGLCTGQLAVISGGRLSYAYQSKFFILNVYACSNGRMDSCNATKVNVTVGLVPSPPIFPADVVAPNSLTIYSRFVKEHAPNGTLISPNITAYSTANSPISYSIQTGNTGNWVSINSTTGGLIVRQDLNAWVTPAINLVVVARDLRYNFTSSIQVRIVVNNTNNPPYAVASQTFEILDTAFVRGAIVGQVLAGDMDIVGGDRLNYTLISGNLTTIFQNRTLGDNATGVFRAVANQTTNNTRAPIFLRDGRICRAYYTGVMRVTDRWGPASILVTMKIYVLFNNLGITGSPIFSGVSIAASSTTCGSPLNPNRMALAGGQALCISGTSFDAIPLYSCPTCINVTYSPFSTDPFPARTYIAPGCIYQNPGLITCGTVAGFGGSLAILATWGPSTQDLEQAPSMQFVGMASALTVSYVSPTITRVTGAAGVTLGNLATAGGQVVNVYGTNFVNTTGALTIMYGTLRPTLTLMNATWLTFRTLVGAGQNLRVVVSVGNLASNASTATLSYANATINAVAGVQSNTASITNLPPAGSTNTFFINGVNFGPPSVVVVVYMRAQAPVVVPVENVSTSILYHYTPTCTHTSDSRITCRAPPGVGKDMYVTLVIGSYSVSSLPNAAAGLLTYATPTITSLSGQGVAGSTFGGQALVFGGTNLGPRLGVIGNEFQSYNRVPLTCTYGPTGIEFLATSCSLTANNVITCFTAPGFGKGFKVNLILNGADVTQVGTFRVSYAPPTVIAFDRTDSANDVFSYFTNPAAPEYVRITGNNFGPYMDPAFAALYKTNLAQTTTQQNTTIGGVNGLITVRLPPGVCTMTVPQTQITCPMPPGTGAGDTWVLTIGGQNSTFPEMTYGAPVITSVVDGNGNAPSGPNAINTDSSAVLYIQGLNFGPGADANVNCRRTYGIWGGWGGSANVTTCHGYLQAVTYGQTGVEYMVSDFHVYNDTHIAVKLVPGFGQGLYFTVSVADQTNVAPGASFDFMPPTVLSVSPRVGVAYPTAFNPVVVTINGSNFALLDASATQGILFGNVADGSQLSLISPISVFPDLNDPASLRRYVPGSTQTMSFLLPPGVGILRGISVVTFFSADASGSAVYSDPVADAIAAAAAVPPAVTTFSYASPAVSYVVVQSPFSFPLRGGANASVPDIVTACYNFQQLSAGAANALPGTDCTGIVALTLVGSNFGPNATLNGDTITRQVAWTDLGQQAPLSADEVAIFSWSDTSIVVLSTSHDQQIPSGYLQVRILASAPNATAGDGNFVVSASNLAYFNDQSPVTSLVGANAPYDTRGGVPVTFTATNLLGTVNGINVTVGGFPCPLIDSNGVTVPLSGTLSTFVLSSSYRTLASGAFTWTLRCILPPGEGMDVQLQLLRDGQPSSTSLLNYAPPVITSWSIWRPWEGVWRTVNYLPLGGALAATADPTVFQGDVMSFPTNGTLVRIYGSNFGLCPGVSMGLTAALYFAAAPCVNRLNVAATGSSAQRLVGGTSFSHTFLQFQSLPGEGLNTYYSPRATFVLSVAGQTAVSGAPAYVNFEAPVLQATTSSGGTAGGSTVTLRGYNFGVNAANRATVFVGPSPCVPVTRLSHFAITCPLPVGSGLLLNINVTVAGQTATAVGAFNYSAPVITSVAVNGTNISSAVVYDPSGATYYNPIGDPQVVANTPAISSTATGFPTDGGYTVTLYGVNFGVWANYKHCLTVQWRGRAPGAAPACDGALSFVGENEIPAVAVTYWSDSRIDFVFPPGIGGRDIIPWINGQGPVNPIVWYYGGPVIASATPSLGSTDGGTAITLLGANFGSQTATSTAAITAMLGAPLPTTLAGYMSLFQSIPLGRMTIFFEGICISNFITNYVSSPTLSAPLPPGPPADLTAATCNRTALASWSHGRVVFLSQQGVGTGIPIFAEIKDAETISGDGVWMLSNVANYSYYVPEITAVQPFPVLLDDRSGAIARFSGINIGTAPTGTNPILVPWTDAQLAVSITVGGRFPVLSPSTVAASPIEGSSPERESLTNAPDIIRGFVPSSIPVGHYNLSYTIAGQSGFNCGNASACAATFFAACAPDFYGRPGETCLPCPSGASCAGFDATNQSTPEAELDGGSHSYPRPLNGFYNLNGSEAYACPAGSVVPGRDVCIVPCNPPSSCCADGSTECTAGVGLGDNICSRGYASLPPMFQCSSCAPGYYPRSTNDCQPCPSSPFALLIGFVLLLIAIAAGAYTLNKKRINIAFVSIAVDYFQVLAIFAEAKVPWPPVIKNLFVILSAFNLNINIVAPECLVPNLGYQTKWLFIMALPICIALIFAVMIGITILLKLVKGQGMTLSHDAASMVSSILLLMYLLYIYLTRTTLEIYNCSPSNPPTFDAAGQQITYLSAVFQPCGQPGGVQMTLLPYAVAATIVYICGYPIGTGTILVRNRENVMLDQLLRAKGLGDAEKEEDEVYMMRKRFSRMYYQFKPDSYYWVICIALRKFFISVTYVLFNQNSSFQLAAVLLVLFVAYSAQVRSNPYMGAAEFDNVIKSHLLSSLEQNSPHLRLRLLLDERVKRTVVRANQNLLQKKSKVTQNDVLGILRSALFNYNVVESTMIFCAIIVCLMGVMFGAQGKTYGSSTSAITSVVLIVCIFSIVYIVAVIILEMYLLCTEGARRAKLDELSVTATPRKAAAGSKEEIMERAKAAARKANIIARASIVKESEIVGANFQSSVNAMAIKAAGLAEDANGGAADADTMNRITGMDKPPAERDLWHICRNIFRTLKEQVEELQRVYELIPPAVRERAEHKARHDAAVAAGGVLLLMAAEGAGSYNASAISSSAASSPFFGDDSFSNPMARGGAASASSAALLSGFGSATASRFKKGGTSSRFGKKKAAAAEDDAGEDKREDADADDAPKPKKRFGKMAKAADDEEAGGGGGGDDDDAPKRGKKKRSGGSDDEAAAEKPAEEEEEKPKKKFGKKKKAAAAEEEATAEAPVAAPTEDATPTEDAATPAAAAATSDDSSAPAAAADGSAAAETAE